MCVHACIMLVYVCVSSVRGFVYTTKNQNMGSTNMIATNALKTSLKPGSNLTYSDVSKLLAVTIAQLLLPLPLPVSQTFEFSMCEKTNEKEK